MENLTINPIILSGNEIGLGIVRSLGMMNLKSILIYYNQDEIARVSKHVSKAYKCPPWSDYQAIKDFLINLVDNLKTGILIPASDQQVEILAKHKKELSKYYIVPVPDYKIAKLFLDKKETYAIAKKAGIDFPLTFYPNSKDEALTNASNLQYPIIIKPRTRDKFLAIFSKKLFVVNNKIDLKTKLKWCYENSLEIMLTEFIPGPDTQIFEYNFYIDKCGELIAGLCHVKLRQAPPIYGSGRVIKTIGNKEVEELTKRFLKNFPGFFGPGQLEFKFDNRDGKYKFIEMNGRMGQQNELFARAGINFAYLYYQEWLNNKSMKLNNYTKDFYHIHLYYDLIYNILGHNKENYSFNDYIKPYLRKHMYHIESLNDPKPMIFYWAEKAKKLSKFIRKKKYKISV